MSQWDFDYPTAALKDRLVLLPGGSGGLGAATAALLAREGAQLLIGYRSNRERAESLARFLEQQWGTRVDLVKGDLGRPEVRDSFLETAAPRKPYGLVCFTGDPARIAFAEIEDSDLLGSLHENYVAPLLLARDVIARMQQESTPGALVFLSSMQAVAPFEKSYAYSGPKVALQQAARILAREFGPHIRVNVVAPGVNRAGMALASISSGKYDRFVDERVIPRFGRPEDVARVVRMLLEPDNYVTGQVIAVDGGFTLRR